MSGDSEQWGPWVEHDGGGCPVATGTVVQGTDRVGRTETWAAGMMTLNPFGLRDAWSWAESFQHPMDVMRYRIRKPRGLTILEGLLEHLPDEVDA